MILNNCMININNESKIDKNRINVKKQSLFEPTQNKKIKVLIFCLIFSLIKY